MAFWNKLNANERLAGIGAIVIIVSWLVGIASGIVGGLKIVLTFIGVLTLGGVVLPIGGYSDFPRHHPNHVSPEEAVQAFQDLGARLLVPMHWGTFELNREPYGEPPDRLMREAQRQGLEEHVAVLSPGQTIRW